MMLCFRSRACSRFYVRTSAIDMYFAFLEEVIDELRGDIFQGIYIYIYPIGMRPDLILPHSTPDPSALFQGKSTRSSLAVETCRPAYAARTTWHMFEDYSVNIGV